jgi:hypothetical protein
VSPTYERSNYTQRDTIERCNQTGAGFTVNQSARKITFSNGSSIQFATTEQAEGRQLDSLVIHGAHYDGEISERAKALVNYRANRRDPICNYAGRSWPTYDPGHAGDAASYMKANRELLSQKGHNWLKPSFNECWDAVENINAKKEESVVPTATPKTHRFYVGSPVAYKNARDWAKKSLAEAVEHAKQRVEETGEEQFIVKVIKVVRRKAPPVVVEDVK